MYRKFCLGIAAILVSCVTFAKPMATATVIPIEQVSVVAQIKKLEDKDAEWDIDDFAKSWQLYAITNPKFELARHYYWQTDKPIGINFTDSQFKSIHTCSTMTGIYRLSALDKGGIIIDTVKTIPHICPQITAQQNQQQQELFSNFLEGMAKIIPVRIHGKKEKILKIQTENYNYIFRSIKKS